MTNVYPRPGAFSLTSVNEEETVEEHKLAHETEQARVDNEGNRYPNLKARLDEKESTLSEAIVEGALSTATKLALKADKAYTDTELGKKANVSDVTSKADKSYVDIELAKKTTPAYVDTKVAGIVSGTPKATYATLSALQTAFPTGTTGVYLVTADGKWYYWSGTAWTAGGVYQSTGLADEAVALNNVKKRTFSVFKQSGNILVDSLKPKDKNFLHNTTKTANGADVEIIPAHGDFLDRGAVTVARTTFNNVASPNGFAINHNGAGRYIYIKDLGLKAGDVISFGALIQIISPASPTKKFATVVQQYTADNTYVSASNPYGNSVTNNAFTPSKGSVTIQPTTVKLRLSVVTTDGITAGETYVVDIGAFYLVNSPTVASEVIVNEMDNGNFPKVRYTNRLAYSQIDQHNFIPINNLYPEAYDMKIVNSADWEALGYKNVLRAEAPANVPAPNSAGSGYKYILQTNTYDKAKQAGTTVSIDPAVTADFHLGDIVNARIMYKSNQPFFIALVTRDVNNAYVAWQGASPVLPSTDGKIVEFNIQIPLGYSERPTQAYLDISVMRSENIATVQGDYIEVVDWVIQKEPIQKGVAHKNRMDDVVMSIDTTLTEKHVLLMGDSITSNPLGWTNYFTNKMRPKRVTNVAVSGATWKDKATTPPYDGNPIQDGGANLNNVMGNQVQKVINNAYPTPDLIIIACGTNDGIETANIEAEFTLSDQRATKPLSQVNRQTFAGSMRYTIEKLLGLYPDAQIFVSTPIQKVTGGSYADTKSKGDIIREVARRMSIPVIETHAESGIYSIFEVDGADGKYLKDGLHPNHTTGAKKLGSYFANQIAKRFIP